MTPADIIQYTYTPSGIDWTEAADVIVNAPLGAMRRNPDQLKRAFEASFAKVFAWDGPRLIGMARAISDGEYQAAIYDVVLLPAYQGKGIGRQIMRRLCDQLPVPNKILVAVPGMEGFYRRCGFRRMLTGMAILRRAMADPDSGYLEGS